MAHKTAPPPEWTFVRRRRRELRKTATEVANELGIGLPYYVDIEKGRRLLARNVDLASRLADVLGVTITELDNSRPQRPRQTARQCTCTCGAHTRAEVG